MDHAPKFSMLGEFRVEAVLGQGGSGIVYDATWGPRRVALKVLHPSRVGTAKDCSQFIAEAQRLQQIMHPSVVKVLAVGQLPDGRPYLAMERLDGETLASVVARGALPLERALAMFRELADAVSALHAQGLVHRDLKPENVFVVAQQHAVLLDFGIAKDLAAPASTTTQEGNVRGTPAYMAPERFFGQAAGVATDVYELAVTLYVMLAGRLPWDSVADPETRLSPRSLLDFAPGVPEALDIEIRRALSTRVQNRPASAAALLDAVTHAANAPLGVEPAASETARLRSGAQDVAAPADASVRATTSGTSPVHAHQRTASAEHPTPLAWAPTVAAPVVSAPTSRRARWPLALAFGAVVVAAGAGAWWRLHGDDDVAVASAHRDAGAQFSANDPWATNNVATTTVVTSDAAPAFALVGDRRTADEYRAEAAAAIAKLPADTHFVAGMQLVDLRANQQTAAILDKLTDHPKLAPIAIMLPTCVRRILRDADWFVIGAPSVDKSSNATFIVRGRWRRADVETCFADDKPGALDFLDEHTVRVSLADKPLQRKPRRLKQLLASLPARRSFFVVGDGGAGDDWGELSLPEGSDVFGWMLVTDKGVDLDFAADPHDEKAAQDAVDKIKPQIDEVYATAPRDAVGTMAVTREGTVVRVQGNLTSFMLGIVTSALEP